MADHLQPTSQDSRLTAIKQRLGLPDYEAPNVLLYKGDCVELMKLLGEDVFDLVVTSPPYNIGKAYEQARSLEDYLTWSEKWIKEVYRLTKAQGSFWLNLGYLTIPDKAHAIPISYLLWDKIPFYLIQEVVWNYGAGVAAKRFFSPRNEKFLWYVKDANNYTFNLDDVRDPNVKYPNQKKNGKIKVNPLGKNPTDVWQIPKVTSGQNRSSKERTPHPAQFPKALIERIIKSSSNEGDIILDPFMGSGTTAEVALQNNRVVVGFEIKKEYIEVCAKRLEKLREGLSQLQGILF
jgi:adenine-specific DNA-methyltransferase